MVSQVPLNSTVTADDAPRERAGLIEVGGKPATVLGADVTVGQRAPDFISQVGVWPGRDLWQELSPLAETAGQVRILAAVPSLDTSTCSLETRRFNQEAAALADDIVIITISTDLPPAQKRWCGAEGVDRVRVVSDHMAVEFGVGYGTLIKERRYLRRAVFVVDREGVIRYADYMSKLSLEPDYPGVLAAARQALGAGREGQ
jgi:thioredoxin-dependent peroxiredoxin